MHYQWGRKPPKPPLPLGLRHPAGGGLSHGHRQQVQKFGKDHAYGSTDILTDRQTGRHKSSQYITAAPASEVKIKENAAKTKTVCSSQYTV